MRERGIIPRFPLAIIKFGNVERRPRAPAAGSAFREASWRVPDSTQSHFPVLPGLCLLPCGGEGMVPMRIRLFHCVLALAALCACAGCGSGSGNPPPIPLAITTAALSGGMVNAPYGPAALTATGGSTPYTWSWSAQMGSTLPASLSITTNADNSGSISGTPSSAGSFQVTVTVKGAAAGQTASANFTIVIAAVSNKLKITTSSLPIGDVGIQYGPGGAGAVLNATGGTPPYTWSWASQGGSTRVGVPPGLGVSTNPDGTGLISGVPSGKGVFEVMIIVTDSAPAPAQATADLMIVIGSESACATSGTNLCGHYTFLAQGARGSSTSTVMIAGSFVADGSGNITTGSLDRATITQGLFNKLITGNYNVGPDGRGTLTINTKAMAGPVSITFTFALNALGTFAYLFESDDQTGTGDHVSGFLESADPTKFNAASITGGYAMGLLGGTSASTNSRAFMLAAVSASGSDCGLASNGNSVFINYNSGNVSPTLLSFACGNGGLSTIDAGTGRGTVSITLSNGPFSSQSLNFAFYVIDPTTLVFISTDPPGANFPIMSGTMVLQAPLEVDGMFKLYDMSCGRGELGPQKSCIFGVSGQGASGSHIMAGRAVGSGPGVLTIATDDNNAGVFSSETSAGWNVTVSPNGVGALTPPATSQSSAAAFVLVGHDSAIMGLADGSVSFGFLRVQTVLAPQASPGTFITGTQFVANGSVPNVSGVIIPTGPTNNNGTLTGTLDAEQILLPPPNPVQISGAEITGTYSLDSPSTGRGTGQSTSPGPSSFVLYNLTDQEVILLESDANSSQPVLLELKQDIGIWDY
jgi:hypothetical protein